MPDTSPSPALFLYRRLLNVYRLLCRQEMEAESDLLAEMLDTLYWSKLSDADRKECESTIAIPGTDEIDSVRHVALSRGYSAADFDGWRKEIAGMVAGRTETPAQRIRWIAASLWLVAYGMPVSDAVLAAVPPQER